MLITGTIINYYFHCKRQCWLFANKINLEDNSEDVRIGRILHEIEHDKGKNTEISIDNIKVDKLTDDYLVEIKKSDADIPAATKQLQFYLKKLNEKGVVKRGRLECIEKNKQSKKIHIIEYDENVEIELKQLEKEIDVFLSSPTPPNAIMQPKCKKCAYYDYCFL